jgi:hypothetical protein
MSFKQREVAMSLKGTSLVIGVVLVVGCGDFPNDGPEERQSALTTGKQFVMVPAYFDPEIDAADFDTLTDWGSNDPGISVVRTAVVNLGCEYSANWNPQDPLGACQPDPNGHRVQGGPGSSHNGAIGAKWAALAAKIQRFHARGTEVYGYVDFYPNRPSSRIDQDVAAWYAFGNNLGQPLDGIFYDDAYRSTTAGLPKAVYYTNHARLNIHQSGRLGRVTFNYGATIPLLGQYVSCLHDMGGVSNLFVMQENDIDTYLAIDEWAEFGPSGNSAWMAAYNQGYFINLVHTIPSDVPLQKIYDVTNQSRILNAGALYLTNGPGSGNTWGHLAQNSVQNPGPGLTPIFDYLYGDSKNDTATFDHGASLSPPPGSCPPQNKDAVE